MKTQFFLIGVLLVLNPFGCTDRVETVPVIAPPNSEKISDAPVGQSVEVRSAAVEECQTGGIVYVVYIDVNVSGSFDEEDSIIKQFAVCNGTNGANGSDGKDGNGVAFAVVNASAEQCPSGGSTILMATDVGNTGVYDVNASNQQSMTICNGQNAVAPAYTPVEPIYACGNNVAYKEVLLRLSNGQVLGSVSDNTSGKMTRLAFLTDGNFVNTDNSGCNFSLSTSGDGKSRSISWFGKIQKSWPISY